VGPIAFPHFEFGAPWRQAMRIAEQRIDKCKPGLHTIAIRLFWRERNRAEPSIKDFG
jgi:hypothetical protein